jgi:serine protease AprX
LSLCPRCALRCDPRILAQTTALLPPVARLIAAEQPGWQPSAGLCPDCVQHYAQAFAAQRRAQSLHTATDPQTTFPYYHPAEETVLSQPERLPDYTTFTGHGVTVAFLDSGYYPHPDLSQSPIWPGTPPVWDRLSPQQWQATLTQVDMRLAHYVDLTDHQERVGLEQPTLWNGAGDSWHGQMTSTIVAGNGLLSGGRYRGYACGATLLPIKIGRGGGRIPEEDILRGLEWLLRDENWARYNVRVLNVSVGGDFVEEWQRNPVCLAATALAERGVLIAAAAGNSGKEELKAPAQTPSVLTVGGLDDHNRPWTEPTPAMRLGFSLYHHNYGATIEKRKSLRKPELLALGRWLPAPILPVSPIFREVTALGELRRVLLGYDEQVVASGTLDEPMPDPAHALVEYSPSTWMPEVWQAVRRRMNAHKWVHPYYQHVDGTSVAVAQVSAVAAQMLEANPHLTVEQIRSILQATALALPDQPAKLSGAGLLLPYAAVAAALRTAGGPLVGYPVSSSLLRGAELQKWLTQGKVPLWQIPNLAGVPGTTVLYLGVYAPTAQRVSVVGAWNGWLPNQQSLQPTAQGWWHGCFQLPTGRYPYRFWLEEQETQARWLPDPENPVRSESGYRTSHSVLVSG